MLTKGNKSNPTAVAVRVKTNLQGTSTVIVQFVLQIHKKKIINLENKGQIDKHNICNDAIWKQILKSIKTFFLH